MTKLSYIGSVDFLHVGAALAGDRDAGRLVSIGEDICYATTNRQNAVKAIAEACDLMIVVGAENSSNSKRLVEVAMTAGTAAGRLVADKSGIDWDEMDAATHIGLSAGASAPENLVHEIIDAMKSRYDLVLDENALVEENVIFKLPPILTRQS